MSGWKSAYLIELQGHGALLVSGIVLVQNALGGSLIDSLHGNLVISRQSWWASMARSVRIVSIIGVSSLVQTQNLVVFRPCWRPGWAIRP